MDSSGGNEEDRSRAGAVPAVASSARQLAMSQAYIGCLIQSGQFESRASERDISAR